MPESLILKQFSAAAETYDAHARVQRLVAHDLLDLCPTDVGSVLELGCGTGYYTGLLARTYPAAKITATDLSEAMLAVARRNAACGRVRFLRAGVESVVDGQYDLVTANAVLHWLDNLPRALTTLPERLAPGGHMVFSYFGPETFRELRWSIARAVGRDVALPASAFLPPDALTCLLNERYGSCRIVTREYVEEYESLRALLLSIKATGTRGCGGSPAIAWTPGLLARVEDAYRAEHGAIRATYQVALCKATITGGTPVPPT